MSENKPPNLGLRLFGWFSPPDLHETIEGDLIEQFEIDIVEVGRRIARRRFIWNVIKFLRPGSS
jgi:putative ABC transport system permease protein